MNIKNLENKIVHVPHYTTLHLLDSQLYQMHLILNHYCLRLFTYLF